MATSQKETATTTTPLRRSPRFHSPNPNPNPPISNNKERRSLSSICKSHPKSTPFSSTKKPQKCASNASENRSKKDSLLGLSSRRRSGRLALMDTTNSFEKIENGGVKISSSKKKIDGSFKASKKDAICEVNHDLPLPRRSVRLTKCNQQNSLYKIDIGSLVQCNSAVRQKAFERDRSECSTEKRKSPRLALMGKNNGESCLKTQKNKLTSNKSKKGYTVCGNASKKDTSVNRRKSKRTENKMTEITKKESKNEDSDSLEERKEDELRGKKRKREKSVELEAQIECSNEEKSVGFDGWSEEQKKALQKAYFTARPSPHFWKKVSKMVPGKNEQECFNKIHSSIKTPPSIPPKSRLTKDLSPFHNFDLLQNPKPKRISKQKRAVDARKTVRSILKKQQIESNVNEADYFSQFESSPFQLPSDFNISEICSSSSAPQKKAVSKLNPNPSSEPSPAVLKPIKNMALHEKYIDHLHCVDAKRKACVRVCENSEGKMVNLKDVKVSLVSEAQDYIGYFKRVQSDPFGDFVRSDEEDEL